MPTAKSGAIEIYYEVLGDGPETVVLVNGINEQVGGIAFSDALCEQLAAQGVRVVRLDNRDAGLSEELESAGEPDLDAALQAAMSGAEVQPPYTLGDMADDVIAVLDALGAERAHLAGMSLGAFIVRFAALRHPQRVASLGLLTAGSGAELNEPGPQSPEEAFGRLLELTPPRSKEENVEAWTDVWRWAWGGQLEFPEDDVRERLGALYDRAYRPIGYQRQLMAVLGSHGLFQGQREIRCPTLILEGDLDPIFPPPHAESIAEAIPGAELWTVPGMGHCLPREIWPELTSRLTGLTQRGEVPA